MLSLINGAKLTWGGAAIVASLGSRFIIGDLTPAQQTVLRHPVFKRAAIFCMLFLPTRDVLLAAALTVVVCAALEHLCNEHSEWCVLPRALTSSASSSSSPPFHPKESSSSAAAMLLPMPPLPVASTTALMGPSSLLRRPARAHARQLQTPERKVHRPSSSSPSAIISPHDASSSIERFAPVQLSPSPSR
jgi:hypothetical protein